MKYRSPKFYSDIRENLVGNYLRWLIVPAVTKMSLSWLPLVSHGCLMLIARMLMGLTIYLTHSTDGAPQAAPCPSVECDCKYFGQPGDIAVQCSGIVRQIPIFEETNATFGSLSLARSNITSLTGKPFQVLRLRALDLSGNPLKFKGCPEDAFVGLKSVLEVISLADCRLNRIPEALTRLAQLRTLHLDRNRISIVSKGIFRKNERLVRLFLQRNSIRHIEDGSFDALVFLEELKLSENQLASIPRRLLSKLSRLTNLDLSSNFLYQIVPGTFQGLRRLEWLDLRSNIFHFVAPAMFRGLRSLENLRLDKNPLLDIEGKTFAELKKLRSLSLDVARNTTITGAAFRKLRQLRTLSLGLMGRETLPQGVFSSMKTLRHLSIIEHGGRFRGLSSGYFRSDMDFRLLRVWMEPIDQCRCNAPWIRYLTDRGASVHGSCGSNLQHIQCNRGGDPLPPTPAITL